MKASSKFSTGLIVVAVIGLPVLSWWASWRYYQAPTQEKRQAVVEAEKPVIAEVEAKQPPGEKDKLPVEAQKKLAAVAEQRQKVKEWLQKRADSKKLEGSVEFTREPLRRDTWNGHTDPDRMWREQQKKARDTLIKLDVPRSF